QAFTFLATNGLSIGSLSNKRDAPGHKYFTPMDVQLQRKMKARLSSYHWTRGGFTYFHHGNLSLMALFLARVNSSVLFLFFIKSGAKNENSFERRDDNARRLND
ncbi:MAG TPA: hypothetical protein VGP58_14320, partial [Pyrinomonadaceae bacterium]|nr:hypothetical protein [Pyrinomonadaceae bacterium]